MGRDWRKLWAAGAVSTVGDGATTAALPLLAVSLTTNPRLVAGLEAFATLPWLLCSLHAGVLADRYDRRRLMWTAQLVQAAGVATVALLAGMGGRGGVWPLYAAAFALGAAETLFSNAAQTILPAVVNPARLERANGRQYATETVTGQFVGPPVGSLLFAAAAALPFWLDAASFLVSAVLIARLRPRPGALGARPVRRWMRVEIGAGLRFLWRHRLLRTLAVLLSLGSMSNNMVWATLVLFATRVLAVGARGYGVLLACGAVGGVLGGLLAGRVVDRLGVRRVVLAFLATSIVINTVTGLFVRSAVVMAVVLAAVSFAVTVWNVATVSLRQRVVPDELRGRVNSAYRLAGWGSLPVGAVLGGLIAARWGLTAPWLVAAGIRAAGLTLALATLTPAVFAEPGS